MIEQADAARFLTQATFGPRLSDVEELSASNLETWLEEQFNRRGQPHLDYVQQNYNASNRYGRHEIFWIDVVNGADQLRQRVAYALSQIFVVSDIGATLGNSQYGVVNFYDLLRNQAFGNYRELLESVTLNPVMGTFLSMAGNRRADASLNIRPDENFAREVLQLFSIGLRELNTDGSPRLSATGQEIPTYDQGLIEEFARVFTGWELPNVRYWRDTNLGPDNKIPPMTSGRWSEYHDFGAKVLLGGERIPANLSPEEDLGRALDNIFNHPNVGPFIGRQLIQRLVTSTPTPAYVARIARVFNDNGNGVRGDLRATVRAVLLDDEARNGHQNVPGFGKLREPVLRLSHLWRAFNVTRGTRSDHGEYNTSSPHLANFTSVSGQAVQRAPSVFNFYEPEYAPVGPVRNAGLNAPEFQIASDNTIIDMCNRLSTQIHRFHSRRESGRTQSYLNIETEIGLASRPNELLDHLNTVLLSGAMSDDMRTILLNHLNALPDDADGLQQRAMDVIGIIVASPDYLIQK